MGFLDGLLGALSSIGAEIEQILVFLFNLIVEVFQFIWGVIEAVAGYLLTAFKDIANFFVHIWDNFFKRIFTGLFNVLGKLHTWLEDHLGPVIKFLKQARAYLDSIYKTYLKPFLTAIQHTRQIISLLRALHIHIFDSLDKFLGQVQADVLRSFQQVRALLNTTIDLLNILADPTMLLRKPTLVLSIMRTWHALIRAATGLPPAFFFPSPSKSAPHGLAFLPANFDPRDPLQNPPASYYLTLDSGVPSFDFLNAGDVIPDGAVDDLQALDYFNDDLWDMGTCGDIESCLKQAVTSAAQAQ